MPYKLTYSNKRPPSIYCHHLSGWYKTPADAIKHLLEKTIIKNFYSILISKETTQKMITKDLEEKYCKIVYSKEELKSNPLPILVFYEDIKDLNGDGLPSLIDPIVDDFCGDIKDDFTLKGIKSEAKFEFFASMRENALVFANKDKVAYINTSITQINRDIDNNKNLVAWPARITLSYNGVDKVVNFIVVKDSLIQLHVRSDGIYDACMNGTSWVYAINTYDLANTSKLLCAIYLSYIDDLKAMLLGKCEDDRPMEKRDLEGDDDAQKQFARHMVEGDYLDKFYTFEDTSRSEMISEAFAEALDISFNSIISNRVVNTTNIFAGAVNEVLKLNQIAAEVDKEVSRTNTARYHISDINKIRKMSRTHEIITHKITVLDLMIDKESIYKQHPELRVVRKLSYSDGYYNEWVEVLPTCIFKVDPKNKCISMSLRGDD